MSASLGERFNEGYAGLWFLSAMRTAYERGVLHALASATALDEEALRERSGLGPDVLRGLLDYLASVGAVQRREIGWALTAEGRALLGPTEAMQFADLASSLGQHAELWSRLADRGEALQGWSAKEPGVVDAQARLSEALTLMINPMLFSMVPGLTERLTRPGAMLDLGAGGAGALVAFARQCPAWRAVGIEPSPVALAIGRQRIAASGLGDRIELRAGVADDLDEVDAYALVYVAQMFFPEDAWQRALPRILRALEPGAAVFTVATCREGDDSIAALSRFKTGLWGGGRRVADVLIRDFERAGFVEVRALPFPGVMAPVMARKPLA